MINILLVYGGGGTEHEVSKRSADYFASQLLDEDFNVIRCEITKDLKWIVEGEEVSLQFNRRLIGSNFNQPVDVAIPCIHGKPGETGEIQAFFELIGLPYFGCGPESNTLCFNKISTKLWFDYLGVNNTPYTFLTSKEDFSKAEEFFGKHNKVYVKAASQGSSVGCYPVENLSDLKPAIDKAFEFSDSVLIEKSVQARELEVAAFEYKGRLTTTAPGEIIVHDSFYSYEEKYSEGSHSDTLTEAKDLPADVLNTITEYCQKVFQTLKLRHLSRIDFFYTTDGELYLNEINTFPGHTSISMFPKMLENTGLKYSEYISSHIRDLVPN